VVYSFNNTTAFEPRLALSVAPGDLSGLTLAYNLVSQLQLPQVYLLPFNKDLGLTRSHHVDLGYWNHLTPSLKLKSGIFYQYLFDVPVANGNAPTFSTLNLIDDLPVPGLRNDGTGENYGVEASLEKYFFGNSYMLAGASYYESSFVAADGIERESRFNGRYTVNGVYGKEWTKLSKNRAIGLSARVLYLGGMKESSIDITASEDKGETVYNTDDPYSQRLKDYFRFDLRLSFRKNKPGYTRTFAIDIQNLSNQQNEASHYYDQFQQKVVTRYQLGVIPVLVYRIDF
ncbi:MAG TPA: TonB-dependent receptor, partial [Chryseosolibacter sp.]|nr:TonB-dependent receptor [Chryseosolibacter sp.]